MADWGSDKRRPNPVDHQNQQCKAYKGQDDITDPFSWRQIDVEVIDCEGDASSYGHDSPGDGGPRRGGRGGPRDKRDRTVIPKEVSAEGAKSVTLSQTSQWQELAKRFQSDDDAPAEENEGV